MTALNENSDELLAKRWLNLQGHSGISRPKDDPPDYVVEGHWAVEVRRLNLMTEIGGETEGIEESEKPLERTVERVFEEYDKSPKGYTIHVHLHYPFEPPTPEKEVVEKEVRQALDGVVGEICNSPDSENPSQPMPTIQKLLECGIHLRFTPIRTKVPDGFVLQHAEISTASRGWVISDAIQNIPRCVQDKTYKVMRKNRVQDYPAWWLVLVDHILLTSTPLVEAQLNKIRRALPDRTFWSRIVVVNCCDPGCYFELMDRELGNAGDLAPRPSIQKRLE